MQCPSCNREIQEHWVACPFCAARLGKVLCECGGDLDPAWKACPQCGRAALPAEPSPTGGNRAAVVTEVSLERCFKIYLAAQRSFFAVFEDAFEQLANASGASEMLASVSQRQLEARLAEAIQNLCKSISAEAEISVLDASSVNQARYFRTLSPHFSAIQVAEQNLADRNIPDGALAFMWRHAANAFTDPAALTAGAFFPGIGNFLGGLWSGIQLGKKDEEAIGAFRASIETFRGQLKDVFAECYGDISQALTRQGVRFAASGDEIVATLDRLDALTDSLDSANSKEDVHRLAGEIERFLQKYPFSGKAHFIYAHCLLGLDRFEEAEQEAYTAYTINSELHAAVIYLLYARIALERWEDASQTALCAIECCRADPELCESLADALVKVPCPEGFKDSITFVASSLQKNSHPLGYLLEARLDASLGRSDDCQRLLSLYLEKAPLTMDDARFLRTDPVLSDVARSVFRGVLSGAPNHINIARICLKGCEALCLGSIPQQKREAAKESFVKLNAGETLVCYCDTTVFGGGEDGFAITDSRILWKELWGNPCAIRYSAMQNVEVSCESGGQRRLTFTTGVGYPDSVTTYSGLPQSTALGLYNYLILVLAAEVHEADAPYADR